MNHTSTALKQTHRRVTCRYQNHSTVPQILRIRTGRWFERSVFPGQQVEFKAAPDSQVEVHSGTVVSAIVTDTIPCQQLLAVNS